VIYLAMHLQPSILFVRKAETYPSLQALPANLRLGFLGLPWTNNPVYLLEASVTMKKVLKR
jgi:hypothetical protein